MDDECRVLSADTLLVSLRPSLLPPPPPLPRRSSSVAPSPMTGLYACRATFGMPTLPDGLVRAGITPVGVELAREVLILHPQAGRPTRRSGPGNRHRRECEVGRLGARRLRRPGRGGERGPLRLGPAAVNGDCYCEGWMLLLRPDAAGLGGRSSPPAPAWRPPMRPGWKGQASRAAAGPDAGLRSAS